MPAGDRAEPCCASQSIKNYSNLILKKDKSVNSLFKGFLRWKWQLLGNSPFQMVQGLWCSGDEILLCGVTRFSNVSISQGKHLITNHKNMWWRNNLFELHGQEAAWLPCPREVCHRGLSSHQKCYHWCYLACVCRNYMNSGGGQASTLPARMVIPLWAMVYHIYLVPKLEHI